MRFGVYTPNYGPTGDGDAVLELARRAEAAGWDGFFIWDHLRTNVRPVLDPWVALGAVAVSTQRITIGPLIVPLARRRAHKVALEAATLASLAPGRVVIGVGMGAPPDFTLFGEEADWRERAAKVRAALQLMRRAWQGDEIVPGVRLFDGPIPKIPIWTSGEWPRKQPFHGIDDADGVFPIHNDGDTFNYRPLYPDEVRACIASLPEPPEDFAIWGFSDDGKHPMDEYEAAGVTWWMTELLGLPLDERLAIVDRGPQRLVVSS